MNDKELLTSLKRTQLAKIIKNQAEVIGPHWIDAERTLVPVSEEEMEAYITDCINGVSNQAQFKADMVEVLIEMSRVIKESVAATENQRKLQRDINQLMSKVDALKTEDDEESKKKMEAILKGLTDLTVRLPTESRTTVKCESIRCDPRNLPRFSGNDEMDVTEWLHKVNYFVNGNGLPDDQVMQHIVRAGQ